MSLTGALAIGLGLFAWAKSSQAQSYSDWLSDVPGFGSINSGSVRSGKELRARRKKVRSRLAAELDVEFRSHLPLVSEATKSAIVAAIRRYSAIASRGGWAEIPPGATLRINESGRRVTLLRRRLAITGDLPRGARGNSWKFDRTLEKAVARFQRRHGLRVSGLVDKSTLRALNVPAYTRLQQLRLNLARISGLQETLTEQVRYVLVNPPAFELQAVEADYVAIRSKVVVGKPSRATPTVSAKIKELNFYPFWRVPESIAHKDLIPQIRKDRSYFYKQHFSVLTDWGTDPLDPTYIDWNSPEVYNYKFRQDPGQFNALGVVRINMPNEHIVYLHDTPLKHLFKQTARAFSSGCVRVQRVLDLAGWLARDSEMPPEAIQGVLDAGVAHDVKLKEPVPVHFVYITAWASGSGIAHFRGDLYKRDGVVHVLAEYDGPRPTGFQAIAP